MRSLLASGFRASPRSSRYRQPQPAGHAEPRQLDDAALRPLLDEFLHGANGVDAEAAGGALPARLGLRGLRPRRRGTCSTSASISPPRARNRISAHASNTDRSRAVGARRDHPRRERKGGAPDMNRRTFPAAIAHLLAAPLAALAIWLLLWAGPPRRPMIPRPGPPSSTAVTSRWSVTAMRRPAMATRPASRSTIARPSEIWTRRDGRRPGRSARPSVDTACARTRSSPRPGAGAWRQAG